MKINFSLKHSTTTPEKTLVSNELLNDNMYIDLGLIETMSFIIDNTVKWVWGGEMRSYSYPLTAFIKDGKRFAEFPKSSVIVFRQDKTEGEYD